MVATSRHQCDCTIMIGLNSLLVLVAIFQVISSQQDFAQGTPGWYGFPNHKCAGPPPGVKNPQDCCQVKPMYGEEELAECGFKKIDDENIHRQGPDCSKYECLLQKRNLLNEDKSIKYEDVKASMDNWVYANPAFKAAVDTAKAVCVGEGGPPGPPQICEANRMMSCIGIVLFTECPTWQNTDNCRQLKEHMDECRGPNFSHN